MFIHVAPYRYLISDLYLSVSDIANPDLFTCSSLTFYLFITFFLQIVNMLNINGEI